MMPSIGSDITGGIDMAKVNELKDELPDIFLFDVYKATVNINPGTGAIRQSFLDPTSYTSEDCSWKYVTHIHNNVRCEKIGIQTLLQVVAEAALDHDRIQSRLLSDRNAISEMPFCRNCNQLERFCSCKSSRERDYVAHS
jgi:hypothetical protein